MKRSFGPVTVVAVLLGVGLTAAASGQTSVVQYEAIFAATWSEQTHPKDFPPNPHFSGLIGGTHNDQVAFWKEGELATPGIRLMAEAGSKSPLDSEIQAAISAGTAYSLISGGGIGHSPGVVSVEFEISETHPLVALVSMIAPSPDWFVAAEADLLPVAAARRALHREGLGLARIQPVFYLARLKAQSPLDHDVYRV